MSRKIYITESQLSCLLYGINEAGMPVSERTIDREAVLSNFDSNRRMICDKTFIAYGTDEFNPEKSRELDLDSDCQFIMRTNKPYGGIWGSPVDAQNGWVDFVDRDDFNLRQLAEFYKFKVSNKANIYVIDTIDDLLAVSSRYSRYSSYGGSTVYGIDFEALEALGCNGIYITDKASWSFHDYEIYLRDKIGYDICGLAAWDVCSICVFSPEFVIPVEENAFEKASHPKRGLEVDDDMLEDAWRGEAVKDRYWLQMQSDFEKYGNQNVRDDSRELFGGKHPGVMAQAHGNSKDAKLARRYNGTIKSGMK